jgi:hypothetical protein
MMILVIKTLTQHEADKTASDKQKDGLDKTGSTPYDDILGTLPVEVSQK